MENKVKEEAKNAPKSIKVIVDSISRGYTNQNGTGYVYQRIIDTISVQTKEDSIKILEKYKKMNDSIIRTYEQN